MNTDEDISSYRVVVNHEGRYSIWPADREAPPGWTPLGKRGLKQECLDYIKEVWTDMRPLSLSKKMIAAAAEGTGGQPQCLHQLFEAQVRQTPEAIALVFGERCLTYSQLELKANQLAHYLQKLGIGRESLVGICLERSVEMIIGLLGVLKAGGAYLPLDPAYPPERLAFMLEDGGVKVLLTQQGLRERLPETQAQVIFLDTDWAVIAREPGQPPANRTLPDNLAYVIYTSGSTGKPKGVMVQHGGIVNYLSWAKKAYLQGKVLDFPLYSSVSFDLTLTSIYLPLISGGRIVIYGNRDTARDLAILKVIEEDKVDLIKLTPSHLALIKEMIPNCSRLKKLILGGEDLKSSLARAVARHGIDIYNEYGPTEATVGCMIYQFDPEKDEATSVPIGKAIDHIQLHLLDEALNPVPPGWAGELYLSGEGIARGYLNRPGQTAERFVPHLSEPGAIMYRTGDLARWGATGQMEYLGRIDRQVKIRGARIELGEIEAELSTHEAVQTCLVEVGQAGPEKEQLIAYYVSPGGLPADEARAYLSKRLPGYMVPASFVRLERMPLNPNGKIDRQALTALDLAQPEAQESYIEPRNSVEAALAVIWADVLGLKRVGVTDNFFRLGGHSLLVAQVMARLRESFQVEIPLHCLFEAPTVAELALIIIQKELEQVDDEWLDQMLVELEQG